jgi:hypothetical protein
MLVRCTPPFFSAPFRSALWGAVGYFVCRSASADPSASCPEGWFCEPPPEGEVPAAPTPYSAPPTPHDSRGAIHVAPDLAVPREEAGYEPEPARGDRAFGVQVGFSFLPLHHIGLELAVDSAFGRDALDAERRELAMSGALLALFDTHELVQVGLSTGLFHSWAHVQPPSSYDRRYRYFGVFLGLGAELTFDPLTSAFLRLDAFMRGRVDEGASKDPEFVHRSSGETSNSSAGALLRVGAARYF